MYISFRQSATRREPVLECGRCGALVTDTARHTDWHLDFGEGLETSIGHGSLETSIGHGAVLSEDQAVEHGLVPDPERTVPPTSSEVAREEERLRRITGRRDLRLHPFPAPVHAVPAGPEPISPEARRVARVYASFGLSDELERLEQPWQEQRDRARSQDLDASLRDLSERLDHEDGQQMVLARDDAAVAEVMRRQGATAAQIAREMELRRAQRDQPSDAGLGPQPLTDPITGHRRSPE